MLRGWLRMGSPSRQNPHEEPSWMNSAPGAPRRIKTAAITLILQGSRSDRLEKIDGLSNTSN